MQIDGLAGGERNEREFIKPSDHFPMSQITYEPCGVYLVIDIAPPSRVIGGLHMPANMKLPPFSEARVIAKGPDCKQVKVGDVILLNEGAVIRGTADTLGAFAFTREDKIMAVVRREAEPVDAKLVGSEGPAVEAEPPIPFPSLSP